MRGMQIGLALLTLLSVGFAQPTTAPATTDPSASITIDLAGTSVVNLWPDGTLPPATQPETIIDRVSKIGRRDRTVKNISVPNLTIFLPKTDPLAAVIVIPGGGYGGEVFDREGYFVADKLRSAGIAAFVLKYRLPNKQPPQAGQQPVPIQDVQRAIRLVRADAQQWHVDPRRVGVMGFSAGGHVAGTAATQFDAGDANAADLIMRQSSRPDFAVLMYAVSSMHDPLAHLGSRLSLLGPSPSPDLIDRYSTAQHITADTPPLLIVHAKDDKIVKVENSIEVTDAAKRAGVPYELMLLESGGHGFAIGTPGAETESWFPRFLSWLDKLPAEHQVNK